VEQVAFALSFGKMSEEHIDLCLQAIADMGGGADHRPIKLDLFNLSPGTAGK
jgi:hypothetical protein